MTTNRLAYHLKNIQHYYGCTKVLNIEELKIKKGSITGLIGPNGSGKSTLLKLLAFAQKPTRGDIFYNGIKEYCFSPSVKSKITLLTQTPYLLKRTVFENIAYGLNIRKDTTDLEARIKRALLYVGLDFEAFAHRKWHQLSGGEAQRVAMAARLILKPEVLLLDEPVASVDTKSARLIRTASLEAREQWGTTLVVASHDLQWLYSISDTQLSILDGNIFASGVENIIPGPFEKNPKKIWTKRLEDGQVIWLKAPEKKSDRPENSDMAIIKRKHLFLGSEKLAEFQTEDIHMTNHLSGRMVSMLLGKKSNDIMANFSVGELSFTLKLVPDQISRHGLHPGKKITLKFSPDAAQWI